MKLPFTTAILALCMGLGLSAQGAQQAQGARQARQAQPPEAAEVNKAMGIEDLAERLKELRRIKAAYPESNFRGQIDIYMLVAATGSEGALEKVLAAQKEIIDGAGRAQNRASLLAGAANMLVGHSKVADFPKDGLLKAVEAYRDEGVGLYSSPEILESIPEERRESALASYKAAFDVSMALAQLKSGGDKAALDILEKFEGSKTAAYYNALGEAYTSQGRDKDALGAFLSAAAEGHAPAVESAKAAYAKVNGSEEGFGAALTDRRAQLPFHPPAFAAPENWQGKAVLAELFTGSECPPCVGADFAFDGFIESYPATHLAILEYHLPIPRYDPMMNPATMKRMEYYGDKIGGTPTTIIDGAKKIELGGARSNASASFDRAKKEIDAAMGGEAPVAIKAAASISGDDVKVECELSKEVEGADCNVALVQGEQEFAGGNGIVRHKMVVRAIETVGPGTKATAAFNIADLEKAAGECIEEWGKGASEGRKAPQWPFKQDKIDRANLKAVVFVQDKESKQVHNAFVVDVK